MTTAALLLMRQLQVTKMLIRELKLFQLPYFPKLTAPPYVPHISVMVASAENHFHQSYSHINFCIEI